MAEIENMTLTLSKYDTEYMTEVNTNVAILQTIVCMVVLPIGLSLVFGIVLYECQGVDSQKRSIFNQLISATFITLGTTGLTVLLSPHYHQVLDRTFGSHFGHDCIHH